MNMEEELQLFRIFQRQIKFQYNSFQKRIPDNTITNVDQRKKENNEKFYFRD
jgi:hypothetical protein